MFGRTPTAVCGHFDVSPNVWVMAGVARARRDGYPSYSIGWKKGIVPTGKMENTVDVHVSYPAWWMAKRAPRSCRPARMERV